MQPSSQPVLRDIVLVGGGHSHVGVLRMLGMRPVPGARITVICRDTHTPYSGMLPGYVAGHYGYDEVHIDLRRLSQFAGARFYADEAVALDRGAKKVVLKGRPPVPYDLLSINIGSAPRVDDVRGARQHAVPVKPIHNFNARWLALLARVKQRGGRTRIAVVGGGAAGVEMVLAMQHRLRNELRSLARDPDALEFTLLNAGADVLPTHNGRVRGKFRAVLGARGVRLKDHARVREVGEGLLRVEDGSEVEADEIVWVTRASGAAWLRDTGLALDGDGFIQVRETLQTVTDPEVFAAGDCASLLGHPTEKAGVFAVRHGPPLARNLRHALEGRALEAYRPQRMAIAEMACLASSSCNGIVAGACAGAAFSSIAGRSENFCMKRRSIQSFQAQTQPPAR